MRRVRELQNLKLPVPELVLTISSSSRFRFDTCKTLALITVKSFNMVAAQFFVASLIAAAGATGLLAREDAYFASLLKRQEPGTPAYNCHDNWCVNLHGPWKIRILL